MVLVFAVSLALLALFAGGFLGYRWGRSVEAKARAVAAAVKG